MGTFVCSASKGSSRPIQVSLSINGKPLVMQLDTGAAVSVMAESTFQKLLPETQLKQSNLVLKTYTGELMDVVGAVSVEVQYGEQPPKQLDIIVCEEMVCASSAEIGCNTFHLTGSRSAQYPARNLIRQWINC